MSRVDELHPIDEWGRDDRFVGLLDPLMRLRWNVAIDGDTDTIDGILREAQSPALLVSNRRWWALDPVWVAWALSHRLGRTVRFVGHPDRVPAGPILRRLGALVEHPAEVRGALHHGDLVLLGASPSWQPRTVGSVDVTMVEAAMRVGVPIVPVAVISSPVTRRAAIGVGAPVEPVHRRRGTLAEVELTERVEHAVQHLLHTADGDGVVARRRVGVGASAGAR